MDTDKPEAGSCFHSSRCQSDPSAAIGLPRRVAGAHAHCLARRAQSLSRSVKTNSQVHHSDAEKNRCHHPVESQAPNRAQTHQTHAAGRPPPPTMPLLKPYPSSTPSVVNVTPNAASGNQSEDEVQRRHAERRAAQRGRRQVVHARPDHDAAKVFMRRWPRSSRTSRDCRKFGSCLRGVAASSLRLAPNLCEVVGDVVFMWPASIGDALATNPF